MLEVRRLARRALLVWPDELIAFSATKGRIRPTPLGFVSYLQRFLDANDPSVELACRRFRHRCLLCWHRLPPPNVSFHRGELIGPVVQCRRIEVRAVRPHQSVDLGIYTDLLEQFPIAQWAVQLSFQDRSKIYGSLRLIVEPHTQGIRSNDPKRLDPIYRVVHCHSYPNG